MRKILSAWTRACYLRFLSAAMQCLWHLLTSGFDFSEFLEYQEGISFNLSVSHCFENFIINELQCLSKYR